MSGWTTPRTWTVDELVTASMMNTHIRDNLTVLKDPPSDSYVANEASDYTTTSTSFVDVDATNLRLTITTNGGDVMVHFHGTILAAQPLAIFFDVDVDDAGRIGGDDGIIRSTAQYPTAMSFTRLITGLAAGEHTFDLMWKVSTANTGTLYAGAGTSGCDLHPQFWAREVS